MYPSFHANKMLAKRSIEMPTRMANAKAIFCALVFPLALFFIMKKSAVPKLPRMAMNARMTRYFMVRIIS
jgi:hypothetical protein